MALIKCPECGKDTSDRSKFCGYCGCPVLKEENSDFISKQQSTFDAVADIQEKLREIDNRNKMPAKKGDIIKSALDVVKSEASALGLSLGTSFETKKTTEKKRLIHDYPLPTSPKALASFAKYIYSQAVAKKKEPDALAEAWRDKLKQVYFFAETEFSATEEFSEIQMLYKVNKRRERHESIRELVVLLALPIITAFILSIVFHLPFLMFVSILAAGWEVFLILYVYDALENMVASIKQHSAKRQNVPKLLRSVAWHLLIPALAALITSIAYHSVGLIILFAILFGVDALFLLLFLCDAYEV